MKTVDWPQTRSDANVATPSNSKARVAVQMLRRSSHILRALIDSPTEPVGYSRTPPSASLVRTGTVSIGCKKKTPAQLHQVGSQKLAPSRFGYSAGSVRIGLSDSPRSADLLSTLAVVSLLKREKPPPVSRRR